MKTFFIAAMVAALMGTSIGICYSVNTTLIEAARLVVKEREVRLKVMVDADHNATCWMTSTGGIFCLPTALLANPTAPAATPAVPRDQSRDL